MKKYFILVLIILEYPLVLIANKIEPTNMAGPGLDLPVLAIVFIFNIFVVLGIKKDLNNGFFPKLQLIVFIISCSFLTYFVFIK
jgi:hypothetical protein